MNWLQVIADKSSYLYKKYYPFAMKKILSFSNIASNRQKAEQIYKRLVDDAINWNKKYAEWYLYQNLINFGRPIFPAEKDREIRDWLIRGNGVIPSIKTSPEELIEMSDRWHRKLREQEAQYKTNEVIAELPDGFKLVFVPAEDAQAEGYHMGHCVGSYCEEMKHDNVRIFSIRDAKNEPHVTIEAIPRTTAISLTDDIPYLEINQIKGKENRPQPKYAPYLEYALDILMSNFPITMTNEGWTDYTGFQEDRDKEGVRIEKIMTQPHADKLDHGDVFAIYRYGENPPNKQELRAFLEEVIDDFLNKNDIFDNATDFADYVIEHRKHDLIEIAQDLLREGHITEDEYEEFVKYSMTDNDHLQQMINSVIEESAEDESFIIEYLLDTREDEVIDDFLSYRFPEYYDAIYEYERWSKHFREKRLQEYRQQKLNRIKQVIEKYGIQIPKDLYDELIFRWYYLPDDETDDVWAQQMQANIASKIQEQQNLDRFRQELENKTQVWSELLSQKFPQFSTLPDYDKHAIVDAWRMKDIPDDAVYDYVRTYLRQKGITATKWSYNFKYT